MRKLLLTGILFLFYGSSNATHIVGGEVFSEYLGANKYRITMYLYIDCKRGNPGAISQDANAIMNIYRASDGVKLNQYCREVPRTPPERVAKLNYNCVKNTPDECVDRYKYTYDITLPVVTGGYVVSFQRCCRNNSITNLVNPESTGANYWTYIADYREAGTNSTPYFKNMPPNFLCTNAALRFMHDAYDKDNDSLAYDFFTPFHAASTFQPRPECNETSTPPFPNVVWETGYNPANMVDGNPILTIDPETGFVEMVPTRVGQFVVGIRVKEFRNGKLIGFTQRDYQFNVVDCIVDVVSSFYAPSVICGRSYKFTNKSTGAQRYKWDFGVAGTLADTSNQTAPFFTFPAPGKYSIKLYAYKNGCIDSFDQMVTVQDPVLPNLGNDTLMCNNFVLRLDARVAGKAYLWSTSQTTKMINVNTPGLYWVDLIDGKCKWRDTIVVTNDKSKLVAFGDTIICNLYPFTALLQAPGSYTKILWNKTDTNRNITVTKPGKYFVEGVNINNCPGSDSVIIEQYQEPQQFIVDTLFCEENTLILDARNVGAKYRWNTGEITRTIKAWLPGTYIVSVTYGKCTGYDTFRIQNYGKQLELGPDVIACDKIAKRINPGSFSKYLWNQESTLPYYDIDRAGKVILTVTTFNGCVETDSLNVSIYPSPIVNLGNDTSLCVSVIMTLDAGPGFTYKWQDGSTGRYIKTYSAGHYIVKVTDNYGCYDYDTIEIAKDPTKFPSEIFMPSAFTPNGDGINDVFPMNDYKDIGTFFELKIFNRWGEKLFETDKAGINWDGVVKETKNINDDVFVFNVKWLGCDNIQHTKRGTVQLLR